MRESAGDTKILELDLKRGRKIRLKSNSVSDIQGGGPCCGDVEWEVIEQTFQKEQIWHLLWSKLYLVYFESKMG